MARYECGQGGYLDEHNFASILVERGEADLAGDAAAFEDGENVRRLVRR